MGILIGFHYLKPICLPVEAQIIMIIAGTLFIILWESIDTNYYLINNLNFIEK